MQEETEQEADILKKEIAEAIKSAGKNKNICEVTTSDKSNKELPQLLNQVHNEPGQH